MNAQRLTGFGMVQAANEFVVHPRSVDEIRAALRLGRPVTLRGSGLSYGDANIGEGCTGLDLSGFNEILAWDPASGVIECEAGVTIEQVWRRSLPDGYWPPVVSGTMFPTLGGALAMNIHGKNNPSAGTLGEHVLELDLMTADGQIRTLGPGDVLKAVIGSAGLLGVITRVKLVLKKVPSGMLQVRAFSCRSLGEIMRRLDSEAEYRVAWIDCFAREGGGEVHLADVVDGPPESLLPENQDLPTHILGFPKAGLWRFLRLATNDSGMRLINRAKAFSAKRADGSTYGQSLVAFNFLLDYVPNWRHAYLPEGFIQYQAFVHQERAEAAFTHILEMQREHPAYLGVMKRHRSDPFLFTHGVDGYSLALDFRATQWPQLLDLCHRMNQVVTSAGGRFYFAKDSTLTPEDLRAYLGDPALDRYRKLKAELDPEGLFTSELARRLKLA